jgi:thioredoxin reductase (NADPH)
VTKLDLIIVGGGPAGLAAGIQASHMGLKIMILDKHAWGGRLRLARKVENFPGLTRPYSGAQVVSRLLAQARSKGLPMEAEACRSIDHPDACFVVNGDSNTYSAKTVIVATGVRPKELVIPGLDQPANHIFYSWRDLPRKKGARVAIVGGGEAAFDQACTLAERGAGVVVLVRGDKPKAFEGLVQEAKDLDVDIIPNATVKYAEAKGRDLLIHVSGRHNTTLQVDYLLAAVGTTSSEITISDAAAAKADRGLYWAGDVCSGDYRQAAIAFGDGIKKAMIVYEYVKGH